MINASQHAMRPGYATLSSELAPSDLLELQSHGENLDVLVGSMPLVNANRILDVGCGSGALTLHVAQRAGPHTVVEGIDLSIDHISFASESARCNGIGNSKFCTGDFMCANLPLAAYDIVFCRYVLMYLLPDERAVRALERMLDLVRPGGCVICIEADINFGQLFHPSPSSELLAIQSRVVEYYRARNEIEWRAGIRLFSQMRQASFSDLTVSLVDGRVVQGGQPVALVEHDSQHIEELLAPVAAPDRIAALAAEWRNCLRSDSNFAYTPVFLGRGIRQPLSNRRK